MAKREHTLTVGRYRVIGDYEAVAIDDDGNLGMPSTELGRLELEAAIAVFSEAESINGDELRFARKAMGLRQPDLATPLAAKNDDVRPHVRIVAARKTEAGRAGPSRMLADRH